MGTSWTILMRWRKPKRGRKCRRLYRKGRLTRKFIEVRRAMRHMSPKPKNNSKRSSTTVLWARSKDLLTWKLPREWTTTQKSVSPISRPATVVMETAVFLFTTGPIINLDTRSRKSTSNCKRVDWTGKHLTTMSPKRTHTKLSRMTWVETMILRGFPGAVQSAKKNSTSL